MAGVRVASAKNAEKRVALGVLVKPPLTASMQTTKAAPRAGGRARADLAPKVAT
jgi:hypothetical protein